MALVSIVTCCSMSCSVGGPSNVMRAPLALASCSAPCLTACQNWCWNPLETIAMYGVSPPPPPPALPDDAPVLSSEPHAATDRASAAATAAAPANRFTDTIPMPPSSCRALARHIGVDRDENHETEDHVLPFLWNGHDLQPVVENGDDQGADDRADDRALAAGQRRAADDHRGDRLKLVAETRPRLGGREARRDHHAGQAGEQAGQRVDGDLPPAHADSRQRRRRLVATNRVRVPPEDGLVEYDGGDHRRHGEHEHGIREVDPEQVARRDL